jgi:DNA-binding response OmpR family regulator
VAKTLTPGLPLADSHLHSNLPIPVLFIEDDKHIQRSVSYQLNKQGYAVTCSDDGEDGLDRALKGQFEVVILDVMLPHLDGLTVCKRIRASFPDLPIIITSARGTDLDKITGLEFGADDYISKPFSPAELEARIRAVRRRMLAAIEANQFRKLTIGPIVLETDRHEVRVEDRLIRLTPKEFEVLHLLMRYPGKVFSREALLAHVWGYAYDGYNRAIDAHINRLRTKLIVGMKEKIDIIESVYGVGYRCRQL